MNIGIALHPRPRTSCHAFNAKSTNYQIKGIDRPTDATDGSIERWPLERPAVPTDRWLRARPSRQVGCLLAAFADQSDLSIYRARDVGRSFYSKRSNLEMKNIHPAVVVES